MKKRAIVWGHKLHSHTQSYVHYGFYRAFKALGYETLWLDNSDDVSDMVFDNCIFVTEGQVDAKIPLNKSCKYIVHNPNEERYEGLHKINVQIWHNQIQGQPIPNTHPSFSSRRNELLLRTSPYTNISKDTVWQPWATDLLPHEIDLSTARNEMDNRECVWVGTYGDRTSEYQNTVELDLFFDECRKNDIKVTIINPWVNPLSPKENRELVNKAFLAPAIQGPWQVARGYTPCRFFKNISYGHMAITNNPWSSQVFEYKFRDEFLPTESLVHDRDPVALFHKAIEFKNDPKAVDKIKYLMNEIKTKHTYVHRLQTLLSQLGIIVYSS